MTTYKVKSTLKHDGEVYEKGALLELPTDVAKPLLADGIITNASDDVEDAEPIAPQPAVNVVKRKNDKGGTKGAGTTDAEQVVEPGKVEQPQPGDEVDDEDGEGEGEGTGDGEGTNTTTTDEGEGDEADKL